MYIGSCGTAEEEPEREEGAEEDSKPGESAERVEAVGPTGKLVWGLRTSLVLPYSSIWCSTRMSVSKKMVMSFYNIDRIER